MLFSKVVLSISTVESMMFMKVPVQLLIIQSVKLTFPSSHMIMKLPLPLEPKLGAEQFSNITLSNIMFELFAFTILPSVLPKLGFALPTFVIIAFFIVVKASEVASNNFPFLAFIVLPLKSIVTFLFKIILSSSAFLTTGPSISISLSLLAASILA